MEADASATILFSLGLFVVLAAVIAVVIAITRWLSRRAMDDAQYSAHDGGDSVD